jgi:methylenetetrahydrofolate--tRNA-(uracil-5-)-methyltransferase
MKPVGLEDPRTGRRPWAVIQLRRDDLAAEHWNMVGFQTKLTHGEQKRVFCSLPGFAEARFVRLGMIHRNTFINAPRFLSRSLQLRGLPAVRLAGQMTGVEGYVESAATGLLAGRFLAAELGGSESSFPPPETAHGGLLRHLTESDPDNFQPSNINWGLMVTPDDLKRIRGRRPRREAHAERALASIQEWKSSSGETGPMS